MIKEMKTVIADCWKSDPCCLFKIETELNAIIDNNLFLISRKLARQNSMKNGII